MREEAPSLPFAANEMNGRNPVVEDTEVET